MVIYHSDLAVCLLILLGFLKLLKPENKAPDRHTVVAEALRGRADFGIVANIATLVACTTRKRRHPIVKFG